MNWFLVNINPEPWAIGPVGVSRVNGKMIGTVSRNAQLHAYKEAVAEELDAEDLFIDGKVRLYFYFWRNRADYTNHQQRTHRKHEADLTNLQKATEDALQGIFFKNDKDVAEVHSVMVAQGPDVDGRILIGIEQFYDFSLPVEAQDFLAKLTQEPLF